MRIAMIMNGFPEISEKFLINQVSGLLEAGIDLDIYAAVRPSGSMRHFAAERYGMYDRARYTRAARSTKTRVLDAPRLILSNFWSNPVAATRALSTKRYATAARNLKTLYFLEAFGKERYDIVHCHFGPNGLTGSFLKDSGIAKALIVTFHGSDINSYPSRHGTNVFRYLYERADLITANTSFTKGKLVANGCPEGKIAILPVGLRMEEYEFPKERVSRDEATPLTVGRLVEKKGHRYLMDALPSLRTRFSALRWRIIGDGPFMNVLRDHAKELGVSEIVSFEGTKNDQDVAAAYMSSTVFVLPSVTATDGDMEGQGLVIQEAQASRLPVVSTLHNGIPDGLLDGRSGILVPEKDSPALADAIGRLLSDKDLRETYGNAGRDFVAETYDIPLLTKRTVDLYESCITS